MAIRSNLSRVPSPRSLAASRSGFRNMSELKGRIFSEEERAMENVYIQKMEREKLERARLKAEKEKKISAAAINEKMAREKMEKMETMEKMEKMEKEALAEKEKNIFEAARAAIKYRVKSSIGKGKGGEEAQN